MKRRGNGNGCIVKRGGVFYLRKKNPVTGGITNRVLYLNGVRCTTKEMAEAAARINAEETKKIDSIQSEDEMLLAIAKNRELIASLKFTLDDIWKEYVASPLRSKTVSEERMNEVRRVTSLFVEWCRAKGLALHDITQDRVLEYLEEAGRGVSARSYNAYREILKSVFSQVWRKLGMHCNPVDGIPTKRMDTQSRKEFTHDQVMAIINGFDKGYGCKFEDEFKIVILLGAFTGCRLKDAVLMKWSSVDLDRRTIKFKPKKTSHSSGVDVETFIHPILHAELVNASNERNGEYVSPNLARIYDENRSFIIKTIQDIIHAATGLEITAEKEEGRARGASQYGMHSFRHTVASEMINAGVPTLVVQEMLGHKSAAMTKHYFHADMDSKARAIEALAPSGAGAREELISLVASLSEVKCAKLLEIAKMFS